MKSKKIVKEPKKVLEPEYTDIVHQEIDGVLYDVYLNKKKVVKKEISRD